MIDDDRSILLKNCNLLESPAVFWSGVKRKGGGRRGGEWSGVKRKGGGRRGGGMEWCYEKGRWEKGRWAVGGTVAKSNAH